MSGRNPGTPEWRAGATGAVICALLGFCGLLWPSSVLTNWSYDLLFAFRSNIAPNEVMIVYMDDDSHRTLRQPWFQSWDRDLHARLIDTLNAAGAKAIVFDILFDVPNTNNPGADRRLAEAARAHGNVIVAGKIAPIVVNGEIVGRTPTPPFDDLRAVTRWGLVEAGGDDRTIRQHYRGSGQTPSLAWQAAQSTMTSRPVGPTLERWLNYYGPPGAIPSVSYAQVLETNAVPPAVFSNKVVYVGARFGVGFSGGKGTDDFRTPYSPWSGRRAPGVEVNATAYLNLLRSDWLRRLPPWTEVLLVIGCGALLGYGLTLVQPMTAPVAGFAGFALVLVTGWFMAWNSHWVFSWLVVGLVQVPTAIGWSILARTRRLAEEKEDLALQLAAEKSGTSSSLVQFTVVSPSAVAPGRSVLLVVWVFAEKDREEVQRRIQSASRDSETAHLPKPNPETTTLTVRLEIDGATEAEIERSIVWAGRILEEGFKILVPKDAATGSATGLVTVYAHGLKIATLRFGFSVGSDASASTNIAVVEHRPRRALACYSSVDRNEVLARIQGMQTVMPDLDVFMDVVSLRPGQDWERRIREEIRQRDSLYLFWSGNAAASKEVEKEWRLALELRGRDFIEPVPLVPPEVAPPPPELTGIHFNDWTLAFRRSKTDGR